MEPAVEKLEALFQKSEADLDYIEKRLKLDFINTASESGCTAQENPVAMLEHLRAIKARHAALSSQVQELASEQRQTMDSLRANMEQAVEVLSQLQNTAQLKVTSRDTNTYIRFKRYSVFFIQRNVSLVLMSSDVSQDRTKNDCAIRFIKGIHVHLMHHNNLDTHSYTHTPTSAKTVKCKLAIEWPHLS
uniref:Protein FAM33A n=1 Tax=Periophthalmus magnuspinnatus TaxID=409849 RepID=A0A3B4B1Y5_9GOBI